MSTALDMSLDDLIKKNKSSGANPRGRGRGAGPGPARRLPNRPASRAAPYSVPRVWLGFRKTSPDSPYIHFFSPFLRIDFTYIVVDAIGFRLQIRRGSMICFRIRWRRFRIRQWQLGRRPLKQEPSFTSPTWITVSPTRTLRYIFI